MSEATGTQIHAHEILNLVGDNDGQLTREDLSAKVLEKFGPDARFFACFAEDLSIDELLPALFERQKLAETDGKLHLQRHNMC